METNLKKIGNSFGLILDKKLLDNAGIAVSMNITIEVHDNGVTKRWPLESRQISVDIHVN